VGQILIRNLPDDIIATYKEKARLAGTSLEQYLRDLMQRHAPFTPRERAAFADEIRAMSSLSQPLTKDEIREGLE
jgi:antitoxin FitA